jgi:uncharacterized membrane protein
MPAYRPRKDPVMGQPEHIARGLGWFSVGIGIAQVLAPRTVSRLCGVPVPPALMVVCGLREIACGIGLLTQDQPAPWLKVRSAGDALDLAGLGCGTLVPGADRRRIAIVTAAVAGVTALDVYCSRELSARGRSLPPRQETLALEIRSDAQTLYRFWRDPANLPLVMPHVKSVREIDSTRSHWIAAGPGGARLEWDSEIIDDAPNERIAWRSIDGSGAFNAGSVQFRPVSEGSTIVRLDLLYAQPAADLRRAVAKLFGFDPDKAARADLSALKKLLERSDNQANPRPMA